MRFPLRWCKSFPLLSRFARWRCRSYRSGSRYNGGTGRASTPLDGRGALKCLDGSLNSIAFRDQKRNDVFGLH